MRMISQTSCSLLHTYSLISLSIHKLESKSSSKTSVCKLHFPISIMSSEQMEAYLAMLISKNNSAEGGRDADDEKDAGGMPPLTSVPNIQIIPDDAVSIRPPRLQPFISPPIQRRSSPRSTAVLRWSITSQDTPLSPRHHTFPMKRVSHTKLDCRWDERPEPIVWDRESQKKGPERGCGVQHDPPLIPSRGSASNNQRSSPSHTSANRYLI